MIRKINNLIDLRHCAFHDRFNPLFEGEIRRPATLAAAMKFEIKTASPDVNNLNRSSVFSYAGIDLGVNQVLDFLLRILPDQHHLFLHIFTS